MERIAVIGAGAWGTALAAVARRAGRAVRIWAREPEVADAINQRHENDAFLAGTTLDPEIRATSAVGEAVDGADLALLVAPAQFTRAIAADLAGRLSGNCPIVIAAKGIEQETGAMLTEVVAEAAPDHPAVVLSGPTFASEVARGLPTAVTLASADRALAETIAHAIGGATFRPYLSDDPVGAEIGGAVKNVIAIACGIVVGRKMGDNARAALITRGLAEMVRLGVAKGGRAETLMGLSGLGDLTLTCNSLQSRNMSLGVALGEGRPLGELLAERKTVAEGVWTAASVAVLARRHGVEMPISEAVDRILHRGAAIEAEIEGLLSRPFRAE